MKPKMILKLAVDVGMTAALLLLRSHFVFFDYEEPLIFFYIDYIAVMGLFIFIG